MPQSLQILTPNMDVRRWFTEMTELTKHMNVCRRNWRNVKEEGRWRTALPRHHRSPATVPQRWTFITVLEGKGWRQSRGNLGTQCPLLTSRQASEKLESQQVRVLKGGGLSWVLVLGFSMVFGKTTAGQRWYYLISHVLMCRKNSFTLWPDGDCYNVETIHY